MIVLFSTLVACDKDSDSETSKKLEKAKETVQTAKTEIKACVQGDNSLEEAKSCLIGETAYTCNSQRVSGGGINSSRININGIKISCKKEGKS